MVQHQHTVHQGRSQPRKMIEAIVTSGPCKDPRNVATCAFILDPTPSSAVESRIQLRESCPPARWLVLLPGAAQASRTVQPGWGASTWAGRQEAWLCEQWRRQRRS